MGLPDRELAIVATAAALVLLPAAWCDLRRHRIPNALSVGGAVLALALHAVLGGGPGLAAAALGLALAFAIMLPFHVVGWLGAGDVKLIAATGAFAGTWWLSLVNLAAIVVTGAVMALALLAWRRQLAPFGERLAGSLALGAAARRPIYVGPNPELARVQLPYGLAIALGSALAFALRHFALVGGAS